MAPIDWNIVTGVSTGATAVLLFLAFLFGDSILPRLRGQPRLTVHASRRASWNEPGAGPGLYVRLRNAGRRRIADANLRVWAVSARSSVGFMCGTDRESGVVDIEHPKGSSTFWQGHEKAAVVDFRRHEEQHLWLPFEKTAPEGGAHFLVVSVVADDVRDPNAVYHVDQAHGRVRRVRLVRHPRVWLEYRRVQRKRGSRGES